MGELQDFLNDATEWENFNTKEIEFKLIQRTLFNGLFVSWPFDTILCLMVKYIFCMSTVPRVWRDCGSEGKLFALLTEKCLSDLKTSL